VSMSRGGDEGWEVCGQAGRLECEGVDHNGHGGHAGELGWRSGA
jgi:hypothetical protein